MTNFDLPTLINWLASGFIGFIFGIAGTWVTYRYERKRDEIAWSREKEKLEKQFEQDKLLLEIQFQQKLKETEQQTAQKRNDEIRKELLKGVDNPRKALQELIESQASLRNDSNTNTIEYWETHHKYRSTLFRYLRWWIDDTPKEMKVVIILSFIFTSLFFLTLILLISFFS